MSYQGFGRTPRSIRAVSALGSRLGISEQFTAPLLEAGAAIFAFTASAKAAQKVLDSLGTFVDQLISGRQKDLSVAQSPADIAAYVQQPPGEPRSRAARLPGLIGQALDPRSLLKGAMSEILYYTGQGPKSATEQAIDQLSPQDLYALLQAPNLTGANRAYVENRLKGVTGNAVFQARAGQQYGWSTYGQTVQNANIYVNAPTSDRNSVGLATKSALDARARNNGQYVSPFASRR